MNELVFLLEEQSARVMLEGLMPRLADPVPQVRYMVFEGKRDLESNLFRRIRGYQNPDAQFVVIRDLDSHPDCKALKARLLQRCIDAGRPDCMIRIFCCELETIYLADLAAVESGLGISGISRYQNQRKFRNPDLISSPSKEISNLTNGLYQKVGGSRQISPNLDLDNDRSPSFVALVSGVRRLCADLTN